MTPDHQSPLDVVDELFIVEYNRFNLIDVAGPEPGDPDPSESILFGADWVAAGPGWLALGSGGQDHLAAVRLEAWAGTPPDTEQNWERSTEVLVRFRSARVQLSRFTGGPSEHILRLPPGPDYRAQVHVRGRSRAAQAHLETARTGELPSGLERWLLRIYAIPAQPSAPPQP